MNDFQVFLQPNIQPQLLYYNLRLKTIEFLKPYFKWLKIVCLVTENPVDNFHEIFISKLNFCQKCQI